MMERDSGKIIDRYVRYRYTQCGISWVKEAAVRDIDIRAHYEGGWVRLFLSSRFCDNIEQSPLGSSLVRSTIALINRIYYCSNRSSWETRDLPTLFFSREKNENWERERGSVWNCWVENWWVDGTRGRKRARRERRLPESVVRRPRIN